MLILFLIRQIIFDAIHIIVSDLQPSLTNGTDKNLEERIQDAVSTNYNWSQELAHIEVKWLIREYNGDFRLYIKSAPFFNIWFRHKSFWDLFIFYIKFCIFDVPFKHWFPSWLQFYLFFELFGNFDQTFVTVRIFLLFFKKLLQFVIEHYWFLSLLLRIDTDFLKILFSTAKIQLFCTKSVKDQRLSKELRRWKYFAVEISVLVGNIHVRTVQGH